MLLETEDRIVTSAGHQQVARATIKTSPKIFNFFADQTYANKPKAICRELVANAFDSHVMAGKGDIPVEVWLPTILDPVFRVRDQGLGMSHEFMMNQFMCYADGSTKDGSNVAIGGFGIGSKSPFAYVDQYTVTSVFDGVESAYSVFKDEDGIPAIGLLGQRETDAPNGVEVSFPVKPEDFSTFEEAAFEALRYFEPLPNIINATDGQFMPPEYVSKGRNWGMRPQTGDMAIIMGGVRYPVDANSLRFEFEEDSAAKKLLSYGLDLRLPIGTCSVALSREALSYDEKTIKAIAIACEGVVKEVAETFAKDFDSYASKWEAAVALHERVGQNQVSPRAKFMLEHAQWKGQPLATKLDYPMLATRKGFDDKMHACYGYTVWKTENRNERWSRRKHEVLPIGSSKFDTPDTFGFVPANIEYLVIDDLPQKPSSKTTMKIKELAEPLQKSVLVVRPHEDQHFDPKDITKAFGNPPADKVILTSSLPEPLMTRAASRMANRPRVRMFTWNGYNHSSWRNGYRESLNPGPYGKRGVDEIPYEDQPETGILVVMENFEPPSDVRRAVDSGLLRWSELLFVNRADAKKLKGFTNYADEFERRKKAELAKYPDLAKRLAVADNAKLSEFFSFFRRNPDTDFTSRKPFGQIFKLYKQYVEPLTNDQRRLAPFVTPKLPAGVKPEELVEKFKTKQWRANILFNAFGNYSQLKDERLELFMENL